MGGEVSPHSRLILPPTPESVGAARQAVGRAASAWGGHSLVADAELVVSELVTNAVLHAGTDLELELIRLPAGMRIEVIDASATPVRPPVLGPPPETGTSLLGGEADLDALEELLSTGATTGRGLQLVATLASAWGSSMLPGRQGKVVWAELLADRHERVGAGSGEPDAVATADDRGAPAAGGPAPGGPVPGQRADRGQRADPAQPGEAVSHPVRLVAVPVRLLIESDMNLKAIIREFQMMELTGSAPQRATDLLAAVTANQGRFQDVHDRVQAALRAALERGDRLTDLGLLVPLPALPAMRRTNDVLDQLSTYCDRGDLLALAPSGELRAFRRWWVEELSRQVGGQQPDACPFSTVIPEPDPTTGPPELSEAVRAGLDRIGAALDRAATSPEVVEILLSESRRSLGASTASLSVRVSDSDSVEIADSIGMQAPVTEYWKVSGIAADLPASEAIRTGRPIVLRTPAELDVRYPEFRGTPLQPDVSFACVPLRVPGAAPVGALNISFARSRDFSPADLRILTDLCAMAAAALDRVSAGSRQEGRRARQELLERVIAALAADPAAGLEERLRTVVEITGDHFEGWVSAFVRAVDGQAVRVAGSHRDRGQSELMEDLQQRWPPEHAADAVVRCLGEGGTIVFQSVPDELLSQIAREPAHLEAMRRLRVSSMVVAPVCEGPAVVGVIAVSNPPGRYVTDAEIRLVQEVAARAGR